MKPCPKTMWVLCDLSNGHDESHRYLWWFRTRKAALAHKKHQEKVYGNAELYVPVKYVRQQEGK